MNESHLYLPFIGKNDSSISVKDYLNRINKYGDIEYTTYIIAIIYLDRLINTYGRNILNYKTIHRYLIASIIIAAKYHQDIFQTNKYYSVVGGIPVRELNLLEMTFLILIKCNLYVSQEEYIKYKMLFYD